MGPLKDTPAMEYNGCMAERRPLRYRGFSRPDLPFPVRVGFLVALVLLSAYLFYVCGRATIDAVQGAGDPEIIWPSIVLLGVIALLLSRASWRMAQRLRRDAP